MALPSGAMTFRSFSARLKARQDSEIDAFKNKLAVIVLLGFYTLYALFKTGQDANIVTILSRILLVYGSVTALLISHFLWTNKISNTRRVLGVLADITLCCYAMWLDGAQMAALYPFLLWIEAANGTRYGLPYLMASTVLSFIGFALVITFTPFWMEHLTLALGLLWALVALPVYSALLIKSLLGARREAQHESRAKSLFLVGVGQSLQLPLNALQGMVKALQDTRLDSNQRNLVESIAGTRQTMKGLITSVLDFSRLEVGQIRKTATGFDLYDVLDRTREQMAVQARLKGMRLSLFVAADVPQWVIGNARHLEEVLVHLTGSSLRFNEEGFVIISVTAKKQGNQIQNLRFEIIDHGAGLSAHALEHIFDVTYEENELLSDGLGGSGLGLAIARQLVEAHGGTIGVTSNLDLGTTFWFEMKFDVVTDRVPVIPSFAPVLSLSEDYRIHALLEGLNADATHTTTPVDFARLYRKLSARHKNLVLVLDRRVARASAQRIIAETLGDNPEHVPPIILLNDDANDPIADTLKSLCVACVERPLGRRTFRNAMALALIAYAQDINHTDDSVAVPDNALSILVTDDNAMPRKVLVTLIEKLGHHVTQAESGEQALQALMQRRFDAVFLDVGMPSMDGIETMKLYAFAKPGQSLTRIIALTSGSDQERRLNDSGMGVFAQLSKPIDAEALVGILNLVADDIRACEVEAPPVMDSHEAENVTTLEAPTAPSAPSVDATTLHDLNVLGGKEFVDSIIEQFMTDAAVVLAGLKDIAKGTDVIKFRDQLHALRSCSANVGARRIYETGLHWREISPEDMAKRGVELVEELSAEFDRACVILRDYLAQVEEAPEAKAS